MWENPVEGDLTKVGRWDFKGIMLSQSDVAGIQVTQLQDALWREMKDLEKQPSLGLRCQKACF